MSENLAFLESKTLSSRCFVDFKYTDQGALRRKRCYRDLITSCQAGNLISIPEFYKEQLANLDFDRIRHLCDNSLVSPTLKGKTLYKNVFCAMCADTSIKHVPILCEEERFDRTVDESFIFILDPKLMHTIQRMPTKQTRKEVCMALRESKNEVCRQIRCPSGKIQNSKGDCVLAGNFISADGLQVIIKLTLTETLELNDLSTYQESQISFQSILENKPWPNDWRVGVIMRRIDKTKCNEKDVAVVYIVAEEKDTEAVLQDVNKFIQLTWRLEWRNKTYILTQSLMDYKIIWIQFENQIKYIPSWQIIRKSQKQTAIYPECGLIEWDYFFAGSRSWYKDLYVLNRLYFCNQIEMIHEEFTLGPDNTYLKSNLTKMVLFNMEFDLIEDEDGLRARVCLEDTIFSTIESNGASFLVQPGTVILPIVILSCAFNP